MNYCIFCMSEIEQNAVECPYCGRKQNIEVPVHHLVPGTILHEKFLIGTALGEGGFGITYIGRDLQLDMRVAIKEYFPNGYANRSNTVAPVVSIATYGEKKDFFEIGRDRFLREARVLARFSSEEGIVTVRDFFEENNTAYIVMEYLDGQTLKDYLKKNGSLTPEQTVTFLTPVMRSLQKVHDQGLIHRDIAPDNIMLVDGKVKLLDFGAARNVSSLANKSLSVMLKPGYAPEEQYRSKGEQGPWTDVYALSATMYKCITGITPDDATQRVYSDELKNPSALGIKIDPKIEAAIMKGLSVLQKDRFQNIEELLNALNAKEQTLSTSGVNTAATTRSVSEDNNATQLGSMDSYAIKSASAVGQPIKADKQPEKSAKQSAGKSRKGMIIGIVAAVVAVVAVAALIIIKLTSADRNAVSQEGTIEESGVEIDVTYDRVYWAENDTFFHYYDDCSHLDNAVGLYSGTSAMAIEAGKTSMCKTCYDRLVRETKTRVPYYLSTYREPSVLGDDLLSGNISVGGDLYRLPAPLSQFIDNGWKLREDPGAISSGDSRCIGIERDGVWFYIDIANYSDFQTVAENCAVYRIAVNNEEDVPVALPGGIELNVTEMAYVESLLSSDAAEYTRYDAYDYYSYDYRDYSSRQYTLTIEVNKETQKVSCIVLSHNEWDYDG